MAILNYSTTVKVETTVGEMSGLLARNGARTISVHYDDQGKATGMDFVIATAHGPARFSLPVRVEQVRAALIADGVEPRYTTTHHAERVAWRIRKDWLAVQVALIRCGMADLAEVMFPYMLAPGEKTVYQEYVEGEFLQLAP